MMKIEILAACVGEGFFYQKGRIVDAPDDRAKDLVQAGYARFAENPKPETATNKKAETAEKR